jgi:hypothetical protein
VVLILIVDASDPVIVISSPVAFPSVMDEPVKDTFPAAVSAEMEKSLVPSDVPLIMSVKFWLLFLLP